MKKPHFNTGKIPWNKGKKLPYQVWNKGLDGYMKAEKNGMWKGGISNKVLIAGRPKPLQCEVCGTLTRICFDHDHKTGKFRGWICARCNLVLGLVRDNSELLIVLSDYLKNV